MGVDKKGAADERGIAGGDEYEVPSGDNDRGYSERSKRTGGLR
jgi:hypothetical protein